MDNVTRAIFTAGISSTWTATTGQNYSFIVASNAVFDATEVLRGNNNNNNNNTEDSTTRTIVISPNNPNNDDNLVIASMITKILIPFVVIVGLFGNGVTASIYLTPRMRQSSVNVLLGGLAVSDGLMLFFGGTVMFPLGLYSQARHLPGFLRYISYATVYGYPLALSAQMCSIYALILITLERYLSVCRPLDARRRWCTVRMAWAGLITCALGSLAYNFCRFYEFEILAFVTDLEGRKIWVWKLRPLLKRHRMYNLVYSMWMELIFSFIIPFALLCLFNARIIRAVHIASHIHDESMLARREETKAKKFQTTWMMIVVILIFLGSNTLSFVLAIVEATSKHTIDLKIAYFLIDFSNLLIQLNAAMNFLIYLAFSGTYRRHFRRKFRRCLQQSRGSKGSPSSAGVPGRLTAFSSSDSRRFSSIMRFWGRIRFRQRIQKELTMVTTATTTAIDGTQHFERQGDSAIQLTQPTFEPNINNGNNGDTIIVLGTPEFDRELIRPDRGDVGSKEVKEASSGETDEDDPMVTSRSTVTHISAL